jgi:hypothetical protein
MISAQPIRSSLKLGPPSSTRRGRAASARVVHTAWREARRREARRGDHVLPSRGRHLPAGHLPERDARGNRCWLGALWPLWSPTPGLPTESGKSCSATHLPTSRSNQSNQFYRLWPGPSARDASRVKEKQAADDISGIIETLPGTELLPSQRWGSPPSLQCRPQHRRRCGFMWRCPQTPHWLHLDVRGPQARWQPQPHCVAMTQPCSAELSPEASLGCSGSPCACSLAWWPQEHQGKSPVYQANPAAPNLCNRHTCSVDGAAIQVAAVGPRRSDPGKAGKDFKHSRAGFTLFEGTHLGRWGDWKDQSGSLVLPAPLLPALSYRFLFSPNEPRLCCHSARVFISGRGGAQWSPKIPLRWKHSPSTLKVDSLILGWAAPELTPLLYCLFNHSKMGVCQVSSDALCQCIDWRKCAMAAHSAGSNDC